MTVWYPCPLAQQQKASTVKHSGANVANAALMYNARFSLTGGDGEQPEVMVCLCLTEREEEKERNKVCVKNRSLPDQTTKMWQ